MSSGGGREEEEVVVVVEGVGGGGGEVTESTLDPQVIYYGYSMHTLITLIQRFV